MKSRLNSDNIEFKLDNINMMTMKVTENGLVLDTDVSSESVICGSESEIGGGHFKLVEELEKEFQMEGI